MIQLLRKLKFQDREVSSLQDNVTLVVNQITKKVIIDGAQISEISLQSGVPFRVNHRLSRQPLGWWVVDKDAAADVFRVAWDTNTITLESNANVNLAIWVY